MIVVIVLVVGAATYVKSCVPYCLSAHQFNGLLCFDMWNMTNKLKENRNHTVDLLGYFHKVSNRNICLWAIQSWHHDVFENCSSDKNKTKQWLKFSSIMCILTQILSTAYFWINTKIPDVFGNICKEQIMSQCNWSPGHNAYTNQEAGMTV